SATTATTRTPITPRTTTRTAASGRSRTGDEAQREEPDAGGAADGAAVGGARLRAGDPGDGPGLIGGRHHGRRLLRRRGAARPGVRRPAARPPRLPARLADPAGRGGPGPAHVGHVRHRRPLPGALGGVVRAGPAAGRDGGVAG